MSLLFKNKNHLDKVVFSQILWSRKFFCPFFCKLSIEIKITFEDDRFIKIKVKFHKLYSYFCSFCYNVFFLFLRLVYFCFKCSCKFYELILRPNSKIDIIATQIQKCVEILSNIETERYKMIWSSIFFYGLPLFTFCVKFLFQSPLINSIAQDVLFRIKCSNYF